MKKMGFLLLLVAAIGIGTSHAGPALPEAVQKSLAASSLKNATTLLESALKDKNLPDGDRAWIELYLAEDLRLAGSLADARSRFESVAVTYPSHKAHSIASLGIAVVDAKGAPQGNVRATLELVGEDGVPASLNADRFLLLTLAGRKDGTADDKVSSWEDKARKYAGLASKEIEGRVTAALGEPAAEPTPNATSDLAFIRKIHQTLAAGDLAKAKELATRLVSQFPSSPYVTEANNVQAREVAPVRKKVGVLLPSTGTWAPAAKNLRIALELAAARSDASVELSFFDSAGSGSTCVTKLQEAVNKQGVSLVIGPLLKDEAQDCAPAAQGMGVPMLALTSWEEVTQSGDHVYRAYPSTAQLVAALLHETVQVRGMKRYAALFPKNPYGENAERIFEAQLTAAGGSLVASVSYDPNAVDFTKTATALKSKSPGLEYDAIFIPDNYGRVGLLAPALAYQELPVGRFRPHSNSKPIVLVGLNSWNNDEFPRRGGSYVVDSIFVDAFNPHAESPVVSDFVSAYKEKVGALPTLVEAVGYDTVRVVSVALASDQSDVEAALKAARLPDPIAGTLQFNEQRELDRNWQLLTVGREGIEPLPVWQAPTEEEGPQ